MILINNEMCKKIIELIDYRICKVEKSNWSSNYRQYEIDELDW